MVDMLVLVYRLELYFKPFVKSGLGRRASLLVSLGNPDRNEFPQVETGIKRKTLHANMI